jgi:hypothetical protein
MTDTRSILRLACQILEQADARATAASDMAELNALVTAAKAGDDVEAELTTFAVRRGISARPARRAIPGLLNVGAGHTVADLYVCPAGMCSRTWLNVPGKGNPPYCPVNEAPMRPE